MTMNPAPLHLDADYAASTEFGRSLVNSMFTVSLVVGLSVSELTLGTIVAKLRLHDVAFPKPVFAGDTLRVETEVVDARAVPIATRRGHRGVRTPRLQPARRPGLPRPANRPDAPERRGMTVKPMRVRSMLFVPGGRPELPAKVGRRTNSGTEVLYTRSQVRRAAHLADVPPIDQAVVAVRDTELFRADAEQARDLGYRGKISLHPLQVEAAHAIFTPSPEEIAHAREVLAAAQTGVGVVNGRMVDAVHVAMAQQVLARAPADQPGLLRDDLGPP